MNPITFRTGITGDRAVTVDRDVLETMARTVATKLGPRTGGIEVLDTLAAAGAENPVQTMDFLFRLELLKDDYTTGEVLVAA